MGLVFSVQEASDCPGNVRISWGTEPATYGEDALGVRHYHHDAMGVSILPCKGPWDCYGRRLL